MNANQLTGKLVSAVGALFFSILLAGAAVGPAALDRAAPTQAQVAAYA